MIEEHIAVDSPSPVSPLGVDVAIRDERLSIVVDVDKLGNRGGFDITSDPRSLDEQGGIHGPVIVGMFAPQPMLAQMEPVVTPEDNNGIFRQSGLFQGIEQFVYLGIGIRNGGEVAMDEATGQLVWDGTLFGGVSVHAAEFTEVMHRRIRSPFRLKGIVGQINVLFAV